MGQPAGVDLLERDEIVADIGALLGPARAGSGGAMLVEGVPGIGKTALLEVVRSRAAGAKFLVLSASGVELELEVAYGIVRQLFAAVADRASADQTIWEGAAGIARRVIDPGAVPPDRGQLDRFAVWHGLSWLCVSLAEHQPLAIVLDDAQWADEPSRAWVGYLARRVSELPVLLVVAGRSDSDEWPLASELRAIPAVVCRELEPLGERSSAAVVRRAVGDDVPDEVCRACQEATGGNPFYLGELVAAGGESLLSSAVSVGQMAPASVIASVLDRLRGLGPPAVAVARAVAVLGSQVRLRHVAALAELQPGAAEEIADRLAAASILRAVRPLEFYHPIIRAAVYGALPDGRRSRLHHRAARILDDDDGADPGQVAVHLLAAEPYGDPWVVERLRAAASVARAQGEPRSAVTYLSRALDEPPGQTERADVLFELGSAERNLFAPEAERHLRAALQIETASRRRAQIVTEMMAILLQPGRLDEVEEVVAQVLPEASDEAPDLAAILVANRIGLSSLHLASVSVDAAGADQLLERLDPLELPARLLRCALAWEATLRGRPLSEIAPLLDSGLTDRRTQIAQAEDFTGVAALIAATLCERFSLAEQVCDQAIEQCARRGSVFGSVAVWAARSGVMCRLGRLRSAEADARQALDALEGFQLISPISMLIDVLVERGEISEALDLLQQTGYHADLPVTVFSLLFLPRRIRLRTAAGQLQAAIDDVRLAERMATEADMRSAAVITWRVDGAIACTLAGETERARSLADEQVRLARTFGAPGVLGAALRAAGIAHGGERGAALLHDSVDALRSTPMRLDLAKSLAALGAAQRRRGERIGARATLADALDLADACGAGAVAGQARSELQIAGARPRRSRHHGRDALTATELRAATLAASGMTNTQIAQSVFVTAKTVERHLTNTYAKLAIDSRHELAEALADPGPAT